MQILRMPFGFALIAVEGILLRGDMHAFHTQRRLNGSEGKRPPDTLQAAFSD